MAHCAPDGRSPPAARRDQLWREVRRIRSGLRRHESLHRGVLEGARTDTEGVARRRDRKKTGSFEIEPHHLRGTRGARDDNSACMNKPTSGIFYTGVFALVALAASAAADPAGGASPRAAAQPAK